MLLLALLTSVALADPAPRQANLGLVSPRRSALTAPKVTYEISGGILSVTVEVKTPITNARRVLNRDRGEFPYMFEVVEVFVGVQGKETPRPYFEFEVSPYNEVFVVKIDPGPKFRNDWPVVGFEHSVQRLANERMKSIGWIAKLRIPLSELGWQGDPKKVVGNVYAILGAKPNKSFWALHMAPETPARFHQPQQFVGLGE